MRDEPARLATTALVPALIGLYVVAAPNLDWATGLNYYDQKRLLQLGLFAATALVILTSRDAREACLNAWLSLPRWALISLALVWTGGLVSSVLAAWPSYALAELGLFSSTLMLMLAFAGALRSHLPDARRWVAAALALSASLYVLRFVAGYVAALSINVPILIPDLYANFVHVRFFSQFQSWTLPLIVLPALLAAERRWRWALYGLAIAWWLMHFGTGTRGTSVGLIAALAIVPLLAPGGGRRWLIAQISCAGVGFAAYLAMLGLRKTLAEQAGVERLLLTDTENRRSILLRAWEMIKADPLLGAGPQQYAAVLENLNAHPHNGVAQWAAEWGVPSTLMMVGLVVGAALAWVRYTRGLRDPTPAAIVAAALTGSIIVAGTHALVSGILVMPLSQVCFALVCGWMLAEYQNARATVRPAAGARAQLAVAVAAALAVAGWLPVAVRDGPSAQQRADSYREASLRVLHPRFWLQGELGWTPESDPRPRRREPTGPPSP